MPRSKTPSFVVDIPLVVDSTQEKALLSRFQAGRQLYNACLNEAMVRMALVRQSAAYQTARKLPKGKLRTEAFNTARTAYRYSEFALHSYAKLTADRSHGWQRSWMRIRSRLSLAGLLRPVNGCCLARLRRCATKCRRGSAAWKGRPTNRAFAGRVGG